MTGPEEKEMGSGHWDTTLFRKIRCLRRGWPKHGVRGLKGDLKETEQICDWNVAQVQGASRPAPTFPAGRSD